MALNRSGRRATQPSGSRWDATADVLVVGFGAAGAAAAIRAADLGASVVVVEKQSLANQVPSSRRSSGQILVAEDVARATGYFDLCSAGLIPSGVSRAWLQRSNTRNHPCGLGNQVRALMPTPQAKLGDAGPDYARATRPGSGGDDLTTLIARTMLPTPRARDGKGAERNPKGVDLNQAVALLPTPRATDATKGSPHQHGSSGDLTLTSAVHLLPTPTAGDARSSAIQTVRDSGRPIPTGCITLTDAARLLPTPSVADALGGHRSRSGARSRELLLPGVAQSLASDRVDRSGEVER